MRYEEYSIIGAVSSYFGDMDASDIIYNVQPNYLYDITISSNAVSIPTVNGRNWLNFDPGTYKGSPVSTQPTN